MNVSGQTCEFLVEALPSAVTLARDRGYRRAQSKTSTTAPPLTTMGMDPDWYELAVQWVETGAGRVGGLPTAGPADGRHSGVQGGEDDAADEGLAWAV